MVTCGASDPGPPQGTALKPRPELPRDPRRVSLAPNSPSTVFFLKRDAMVSGRARAAQLGPVRSGRVLGTGPVEGRIPEKARSDRRRTGSPSSTRDGRGSARLPRTRPRSSGDRELRHFFWRSHF